MTSAFASIPTVTVVSSDSRVKVEQLPHSDRILGPLHYDCLIPGLVAEQMLV